MGRFMGRENQNVQVKVLYCKLPTISKQLPTFPLQARIRTLISEVEGESVTTLPSWSLGLCIIFLDKMYG